MFINVYHQFHSISAIFRSALARGTSTPLFSGLLEEPDGDRKLLQIFTGIGRFRMKNSHVWWKPKLNDRWHVFFAILWIFSDSCFMDHLISFLGQLTHGLNVFKSPLRRFGVPFVACIAQALHLLCPGFHSFRGGLWAHGEIHQVGQCYTGWL